ncbi:MAG: type VI secretion system tube protein Hcp [Sedimentisphaerales bacterium]|nr:type VI secretion system tube protein Hcp [Sedimentisphaerales bacterium]
MAFDAFLKIDVIPGESTDDKHKDWIEISSFNHGLSQMSSGSRSSGGAASSQRCDHQDFSVVKALDKSSPKLALACCTGEHIKKIQVELCRATKDKTKYMEFTMSDVIVSSVRPGGSASGEALPVESVSFNYGKIEWIYTLTDHATGAPKGDVKAHWDTKQNKGG